MLVALIAAFAAYAPAHVARGICSGIGPLPRLRHRDGHATASCASSCASLLAVVGVDGRRAVRLRRRPRPAGRRRRTCSPGAACTPIRAPRRRGARSRRTSAGCCSARCSPPRCSTPARSPPRSSPTTATRPLVTQFAYGVLLARIPLFMFQAVQAALLPRLSRLAATGELDEFRAGLRRLLMVVLAVGVVGTLGRPRARPVRDRRSSTAPTSPAGRWPCSPSAAPATWSPWRWPRR